MEEQEKICRLCLKNCGNDFMAIEKNVTEILVFLLKSNPFINEESVMCANCSESIKDCYHFKRISLDVEDSVVELINRSDSDATLKEANEDDHEICRLCMGSLNICSFISVDSKLDKTTLDQIMLNKCLPELDKRVAKPIICVPCRVSLQRYFDLITNFSIVEEKIKKYCEATRTGATGPIILKDVLKFTTKNTLDMVDSIKMEDKFCEDEYVDEQKCNDELCPLEKISTNIDVEKINGIKTGTVLEELDCKIEVKSEDFMKIEDHQSSNMPKFTIKCKEDDGHQVDVVEMEQLYCQKGVNEVELKQQNLYSLRHDDDISPQMDTIYNLPKTQECSLAQPHRMFLQVLFVKSNKQVENQPLNHLLAQESSSEENGHELIDENSSALYPCEYCSFKTKYKWSLKYHLLTHKNSSEITIYQCEHCSFKTKHKQSLKCHLLTHKNSSKITMYKCEHCSFETVRKKGLIHHLLIHRNPSELTMYQCEHCSFQTKYKLNLKSHLLNHKNISEVTIFRCEHCSFNTKYKGNLKNHLLGLKNPSAVTTFNCERCSFRTKCKGYLNCHLLVHKSPSEVTIAV